MDDLLEKRKAIERRELRHWSRRGRSGRAGHSHLVDFLVKIGLRATGLYNRARRNALNPVLRHLRLTFASLPEAFNGFRILHMSDLHVDGCKELTEIVSRQLQGLEVDLCVLTGDYQFGNDGPCQPVYTAMQRILDGITARHGFVGTLGNHDLSEMLPEFEQFGVTMLYNQALEIRRAMHSLWFVGLDDPHYFGCDNLDRALDGVPDEAFKVLLVHTPELYEEAAQWNVQLYLCGHTHGGQLCLPWIGPMRTNSHCPRKYARGLWQHRGLVGYTNSGIGCSGVYARLLCPPELALIELRGPD